MVQNLSAVKLLLTGKIGYDILKIICQGCIQMLKLLPELKS